MKLLFIGGTGTISMAITNLASQMGMDVTLLNRGNRNYSLPENVRTISADIGNEEDCARKLEGEKFDCVCDFICFLPEQAQRDIRLFEGKTRQFIFISSASCYQKPLSNYLITESTPLCNPFWQYSRDKIACEDVFMDQMRRSGFPVTIVRPSHTYDNRRIPVAIHGEKGSWQVIERIRQHKPVVVHGDGQSLWTFTHNEDFARAFMGLVGNPHALGEAVNITSDESLTWDSAYRIIGNALGEEPVIHHVSSDKLCQIDKSLEGPLLGDKANSVVFDNTKLKRLVPGFTAQIRFDQGVGMALRYIEEHPEECQIPDPEFDRWCDEVCRL